MPLIELPGGAVMQLTPRNRPALLRLMRNCLNHKGLTVSIESEDRFEAAALKAPQLIDFPWNVVVTRLEESSDGISLEIWHNGGISGFSFRTFSYENRWGRASHLLESGTPSVITLGRGFFSISALAAKFVRSQHPDLPDGDHDVELYTVSYTFHCVTT